MISDADVKCPLTAEWCSVISFILSFICAVDRCVFDRITQHWNKSIKNLKLVVVISIWHLQEQSMREQKCVPKESYREVTRIVRMPVRVNVEVE